MVEIARGERCDPVDVLIADQRAIVPGAVIAVRPIGVFLTEDEAGRTRMSLPCPFPG